MNERRVHAPKANRRRTYRIKLGRGKAYKVTCTKVRPLGFLDGIARIFDFTGSLNTRRYRGSGFEADAAALRSDWIAVGNDIRTAMGQFEREEGIGRKSPD